MAMYSKIVIVIMLGGIEIINRDNGYGGTPEGIGLILPLIMVLLTLSTGIAGYMHKDGE